LRRKSAHAPPKNDSSVDRAGAGTSESSGLAPVSENPSLEKSRNSLETGYWRRSSFHASL
jgi:hypothetical protein